MAFILLLGRTAAKLQDCRGDLSGKVHDIRDGVRCGDRVAGLALSVARAVTVFLANSLLNFGTNTRSEYANAWY